MTHIMLDLETLGTSPGCAILSIGAVEFNPRGRTGAQFYVNVDRQTCFALGLIQDPGTVAWWARQSQEAKDALLNDVQPVGHALMEFTKFFKGVGGKLLWAHGATFDPPVLDAVYRAAGYNVPWQFWNVRDTRTLYDLAGIQPDRNQGVHHNALNDAIVQAEAAIMAYRKLGV